MLIDFIFLVLLAMAALRGYRQGLIVGVLSYLAFIIGLAAAIKLSALVAAKIATQVNISDKWMPFLAFSLVFVFVVMLVKWVARLAQSAFESIKLGWLNRIGGVFLFSLIYISGYAIFLFYISRLKILSESIGGSVSYGFIKVFGGYAIDTVGSIVPVLKNMFVELEHFFEGFAQKNN